MLICLAQAIAMLGPDRAGNRREGKARQGEQPLEGGSSTTCCCYCELINMGNE